MTVVSKSVMRRLNGQMDTEEFAQFLADLVDLETLKMALAKKNAAIPRVLIRVNEDGYSTYADQPVAVVFVFPDGDQVSVEPEELVVVCPECGHSPCAHERLVDEHGDLQFPQWCACLECGCTYYVDKARTMDAGDYR